MLILTFTTPWAESADYKLIIYFSSLPTHPPSPPPHPPNLPPENRRRYLMQIQENLYEVSIVCFVEK